MLSRCTICLEDFSDLNPALTTACGHLYCIDCATFVFANDGATCAVCRKPNTLDALIRLYPDWDNSGEANGGASGSMPKRTGLGEMGNDVLDACHTVLESGIVTNANVAPVLYRAENLVASISRRKEAPDLQYLLQSLTEVFSELRAKIQDSDQTRDAQESAARMELQRQQRTRVLREVRVRKEEQRNMRAEFLQQHTASQARIQYLEERLQELTQDLAAERARVLSNRMTMESLQEEMRQWRSSALKYKKKYHVMKQEVGTVKRSVTDMFPQEDSLDII
ncbi:hypothetical protein B0H21DRAFT_563690 [Amylocystis lapponica]|nr:hypothetical protein B0H21DRAFT_563690 [Amylocystis lapponica]